MRYSLQVLFLTVEFIQREVARKVTMKSLLAVFCMYQVLKSYYKSTAVNAYNITFTCSQSSVTTVQKLIRLVVKCVMSKQNGLIC